MAAKWERKHGIGHAPGYLRLTDQDKDLPLNERIYRRIRHLIWSGVLQKGTRIASSRTLAEHLNVSRNSVLDAIDRLIADGFLKSRGSSGIYVSYSGRPKAIFNAERVETENVPLEYGWGVDVFPIKIWRQLQLRYWRNLPDFALIQGARLGLPELRETIATYVALNRGIECLPEQVIVTTSIPSAVNLVVRALQLQNTTAWIENPSAPHAIMGLLNCNVNLVPVPVDESGIDVAAGIRAAPDAQMALVTPICQAPRGVAMSEERRAALLQWAQERSAWILEDDFNWNGDGITRTDRPLAAVDPSRVIYLNSFNHIMFTGLRIAYFIIPVDLLNHVDLRKGIASEVNTPNQLVLTNFIESGYLDAHMRKLNAQNAERRAALDAAAKEMLTDYLTPQDTKGNYYICTVRNGTEKGVIEAASKGGIILNGLSDHYAQSPPQEEVILGFSQYDPKTIYSAIKMLRTALQKNM